MDENLVGYLLNALEPEQQRELEQHLNENPAVRHKLDLLRRALEPLAADKEPPDPPAGLAFRTLARVAEYRCRPQPEVPAPPPVLPLQSGSRWYRRADILIAASLLILVGGVGVPGLVKLRSEHQKSACQDNLRVFSKGFSDYCSNHGEELPAIGDRSPYERAGFFVSKLRDEGVLPTDAHLRCPANRAKAPVAYTLKELEEKAQAAPEEFEQIVKELSGCYAYSLGYKDAEGQNRPLRRGTVANDHLIPIMADKPSVNGDERGNSPNHNRRGQNILYLDGHVEFHTTPFIRGNDHIYLNNDGKVAAGLDPWDTVLGRSEDKP